MKKVKQDDGLLKESKLRRKKAKRTRNEVERLSFENRIKKKIPLDITFIYWYSLHFTKKPNVVKSVTLSFNKPIIREWMEEKIRNALESV